MENSKQRMKGIVVEILVDQFGLVPIDAASMTNQSSFAKILEIDPEFVGHYSAEYWAEHVISEDEMLLK